MDGQSDLCCHRDPNATPLEAQSGSNRPRTSASRSPRVTTLQARLASREPSPGTSAGAVPPAGKRRRRREKARKRPPAVPSDPPKLGYIPGHESVNFSQEKPVARKVTLTPGGPPDRRTLGQALHPTLAERSPTPAARANSPLTDPRAPLPAFTFPGEAHGVVSPPSVATVAVTAKAADVRKSARAKAEARRKHKGKGKDKGKDRGEGLKGRGAAPVIRRPDQATRKAEQRYMSCPRAFAPPLCGRRPDRFWSGWFFEWPLRRSSQLPSSCSFLPRFRPFAWFQVECSFSRERVLPWLCWVRRRS